ncbi:MAG: AhpC/TSA family protein [Sphingobacteriales bacterium]|nr:MAG: AhpC/TSA family protein [Sphingobacteriales bacterium]TAF78707.1 MAG: AhpC/TSA family protein [Sphingobacteriales bacterium]
MKNFIVIIFTLLIVGCKDKTKFVINGKINNASESKQMVRLLTQTETGEMLAIDSAIVGENKTFKLKAVASNAAIFQILYNNKQYLLVAQNGNQIQLLIDEKETTNFSVEGSYEDEEAQALNKLIQTIEAKNIVLGNKFSQLIERNPEQKDKIMEDFTIQSKLLITPFLKEINQFLSNYNQSLTAFYAANLLRNLDEGNIYESSIFAYAKAIKGKFNNNVINEFVSKIEGIQNISVGKQAPNIIAETPEGKISKLSDFRGKYVLIDFWASWCGPCREENPNVVQAFKKYKNKNFIVFGVSLDDDKDKWVNAIEDDQLTWTQVSDFKGFESPIALTYNVDAIPFSILINPEGKIIAKNLRGRSLESFLNKTLN